MNPREIIYDRFIKPFAGKTGVNVGVELEFPLINNDGGDVDTEFVASIMNFIEQKGFSCVLYGVNGEKLFMENEKGDCLSFDNSYNNFEFSMMYGENLCKIKERFDSYYAMVQEYLHKFPGTHGYNDFPAFMSSVQTHLDISENQIPEAYTLFCRMDFIRGLLFGNSPDFEGKGWRIFRDYLWEKSGFGNCPQITGSVDRSFKSTDDVIDFFLEKGIFNRIRNGKYEIFQPVTIEKYFTDSAYGAEKGDIECYLSFRNVELTSRGTLEIRSDCTQKEGRFFLPPAFNLGILNNMKKAKTLLDNFIENSGVNKSNSVLRQLVNERREEEIAPEFILDELCAKMLDIARDGLIKRGKGEEELIVF